MVEYIKARSSSTEVWGYVEALYRHDQPYEAWPRQIEVVSWAPENPPENPPVVVLPNGYDFYYHKEAGIKGSYGPYIFLTSSVEGAIRDFVGPRNDAGGRASSVRLVGDTIIRTCEPGYGVHLEGVETFKGKELYLLFCHQNAQAQKL